MADYGEPWKIKLQPSGLYLLVDRDGKIIPFFDKQKARVVECINFAQGVDLDEFIPDQNWHSLIERMHGAEHDLEEERENFKQLQYAFKEVVQDYHDLVRGVNRMGLNHNAIMSAEAENRRNGIP